MSYQVIARKWRPQQFDEVYGQDHVATALRNAIRSDRIPHALLFTGPRGVGKTTLARLLARCLNCDNGPTDEPCGKCDACEEIASGRSTDVQEIDAASRTSVDDVREVIEAIRYAPSPGKYRIFVIDEVHMLSTAAFNALLKTLEEPPPRSLFVFATTNPEKIPFTVISRCQRYDLRRITVAEIIENLAKITKAEGIQVSQSSLQAIAREGDGSMRDAQTLLDQIIAYGGTEISDETVGQVLDLIDRRILHAVIEACVDADAARALEACAAAVASGTEAKRLAEALVGLLRDLVVSRVAPDSKDLVEGTDEERADLAELAGRCEPARLRRMFRALVQELEDLTWAPQPYAVLEMAIVRLATMPAGDDVSKLLGRLDRLERQLSSGRGPGGGGAPTGPTQGSAERRGGSTTPTPRQGRAASRDGQPAPKSASEAPRTPPATRSAGSASKPPAKAPAGSGRNPREAGTPAAEPAPRAEQAETGQTARMPGGDAPDAVIFDRLRSFAQEQNRSAYASLDSARLLGRGPGKLKIGAEGPFHFRRLDDRRSDLGAVCSQLFDTPVEVELSEITAQPKTGDKKPEAREFERKRKQEALNSESVNIAIEVLGAEIVEIRPLGDSK